MSEPTIRARIKTVVDAVSNSGLVHDYMRWADLQDDMYALFVTTISGASAMRAWTITCNQATPIEDDFNGVLWQYRYVIRGYWQLDDSAASEKSAFAMGLAVMAAIDADATLQKYYTQKASMPRFEPFVFAGVLAHYTEIEFAIAEEA